MLDKIVKPLLKQRVPIHGIGMQAHMKSYSRPSLDDMISVMRSYESLGMDVAVTELVLLFLLLWVVGISK